MTVAEYLAQEDPQRLFNFSVDVTREDCKRVWQSAGDTYFQLKAYPDITYVVPTVNPKDMVIGGVWTTDSDGNAKRASVFKFVG
jgi:hypothetical protein